MTVIDLEKLQRDLQEVSQAIQRGHLTRPELIDLKINLAWAQVAVRQAMNDANYLLSAPARNQRGY